MDTEYRYTVIFEQLPEGGYNVLVPAIPEICTFGETLEEARTMAKDAIQCFIESARKTGERIPQDLAPTKPGQHQRNLVAKAWRECCHVRLNVF
ncbi:MAG: type II toxin-antitoxin system HicB family antitoxin [Acidobacteria bacterium]|nr:type II toxin-antitoxin system HicB family antitoxin [Acidobacteriota bacterium]